MSEGHLGRTKMILKIKVTVPIKNVVFIYFEIIVTYYLKNLFKILPSRIIDNLNKTMHVRIVLETIVSKVKNTVVLNRH